MQKADSEIKKHLYTTHKSETSFLEAIKRDILKLLEFGVPHYSINGKSQDIWKLLEFGVPYCNINGKTRHDLSLLTAGTSGTTVIITNVNTSQ